MNPSLLQRLVCPSCGGPLHLEQFMVAVKRVAEGALLCEPCRAWYPISRGVRMLLDFPVALHDQFEREYGADLRGFAPPRGTPRPGAASVQESFSERWEPTAGGELSSTYSDDDLEALRRRGPRTAAPWLSPQCRGRERSKAALEPVAAAFARRSSPPRRGWRTRF